MKSKYSRLLSGVSLGLLASALLASTQFVEVGADVTKKGGVSAGDTVPITELSGYTIFSPRLPDAPPAQFRFTAPIDRADVEIVVAKHSCRSDYFRVLVDSGDGKLTRDRKSVV